MPDKEKKSEFTVTDRRLFSSEGELRPDVVEAEERREEREQEKRESQRRANEERSAFQRVFELVQPFLNSTSWRGFPADYLHFLADKLGSADDVALFIDITETHGELREKVQQWADTYRSDDEGTQELVLSGLITTLNSFGDVMTTRGEISDAKHAFQLSLKFHYQNPQAWFGLALLLSAEDNPEAAKWANNFLAFKPSTSSNSLIDRSLASAFDSPEMKRHWAEMTTAMQEVAHHFQGGGENPHPPTTDEQSASAEAYKKSTSHMDQEIRKELDKHGQGHRAQDFEMNFEKFIASLYMSALMQMGMAAPEGGQPQVDLMGARQTIDIIGLLQEKTKGNLTSKEETMLQNVLYELRMAYLEVTNLIAKAPPPGKGGNGEPR